MQAMCIPSSLSPSYLVGMCSAVPPTAAGHLGVATVGRPDGDHQTETLLGRQTDPTWQVKVRGQLSSGGTQQEQKHL